MHKKHTFSLTQFMCILTAIITLVILSVTGMIYSASVRMIDKRLSEIGYSSVTTSGQLIDQTLSSIDQFIFDLMYDNSSLDALNKTSDPLTLYTAKQDLSGQLQRMGRLYTITGSLIYFSNGASEEKILSSSNPRLLKQNTDISSELITSLTHQTTATPLPDSEWFLFNHGSARYLVRIILFHEVYCAVWIDENNLIGQFISSENDVQGSYFFSSASDISDPGKAELVQYLSHSGNFSLCLDATLNETDSTFQLAAYTIVIALILLIPVLILCGYHLLYLPFRHFNSTMLSISSGSLLERADDSVRIREFNEMYGIFNRLMDDIQTLQADIYENKLDKQRVEQQFLHIQIRNHFFLNCLNIIYSLAQVKDYQLIQQMTLYLVSYFRHISRNAMEGVALLDELSHVQDYIHIQQIRFPDRIQFQCHMEEALSDFRVPSLILLTFIENCIKHALTSSPSSITLDLKQISPFGKHVLYARISDNGPGFSEEQLDELNSTDVDLKFGEIHGIGIHNIRKRLQLLYHSEAQLFFSNQKTGGALIELYLPPWNDHTER